MSVANPNYMAFNPYEFDAINRVRQQKALIISVALHGLVLLSLKFSGLLFPPPEQIRETIEITFTSPAPQASIPEARMSAAPAMQKAAVAAAPAPAPAKSRFSGLLSNAKKFSGIDAVKTSQSAPARTQDMSKLNQETRQELLKEAGKGDRLSALSGNAVGKVNSAQAFDWGDFNVSTAASGSGNLSDIDIKKIQEVLFAKRVAFRDCYESSLLQDNTLAGKVALFFDIGAGGSVLKSGAKFNGNGSPAGVGKVEQCLSSTIRQIKFPASLTAKKFQFSLRLR